MVSTPIVKSARNGGPPTAEGIPFRLLFTTHQQHCTSARAEDPGV